MDKTSFRIKTANGIISQRDFLNALAHRVFFSTQYIRHHDSPEYSPEPDIVHEVIGHIPMLSDPAIADISQRIGLLSLGASEEQLKQLGSIYWFTIEYGACLENGKMKAYGAGIASSTSECENFLSGKAQFDWFNPLEACIREYPTQIIQPAYLYNNSLDECLESIVQFGNTIKKPINIQYDVATQTIIEKDQMYSIMNESQTVVS